MGQVLGLGLIAGEPGKGAVDRPPSPAAQLVQGPLVARLGKAKQRRDALPASGQERPRQLVRVLQLSDQVHPPLQQQRVHREQRRHERVG